MQCNYVIEDLAKLSPDQFGFSETEFNNLKTQCRALRAWFYLRLLDGFRNIPLAVSFNDVSLNTEKQVEPKVIFKFIEDELKDCLPLLAKKTALGSGANLQGQWTQAGAAALLAGRLLSPTPAGASVRLRRLVRMEVWTALIFVAGAVFLFLPQAGGNAG